MTANTVQSEQLLPQQLDVCEGTTGGIGKANCDTTGGTLDGLRTALMNKWVTDFAPIGLKVITLINSALSIFCGALQTWQGILFLRTALITDWVFGTYFGLTRTGCGLSLLAGGVLTLIQHIYESLQVLGKVTVVAGKFAPFAYMTMFIVLIGMCFLYIFKERGVRKDLNAIGLKNALSEIKDLPDTPTSTEATPQPHEAVGIPIRYDPSRKHYYITHETDTPTSTEATPQPHGAVGIPIRDDPLIGMHYKTHETDTLHAKEQDAPYATTFLKALRENTFVQKTTLEKIIKTDLKSILEPNLITPAPDLATQINDFRKPGSDNLSLTKTIKDLNAVNHKIDELKMLVRKDVIKALETGGKEIQGANAVTVCKQLDADLTEKKRFFILIGVASVLMILVMGGSLCLNGPVWAGVLFGIGIALAVVFAYGNVKNMEMTLRDIKGAKKDRVPVYIIAALIALVGGFAIMLSILNPVALAWILIMAGIILYLEVIQVYLLYRMQKNREKAPTPVTHEPSHP